MYIVDYLGYHCGKIDVTNLYKGRRESGIQSKILKKISVDWIWGDKIREKTLKLIITH